ncbi:TPA: M23 family peptidase, partial [Enterococcus faecalis]|nr:M23 family peptidase [Enterococcus faecalis]
MKKTLISVLGVLSIVVSMAFSSYSVNAASNDWSWPLGKPY